MKQRTLYTCEHCNRDYTDKKKALDCEAGHAKIVKIQRADYVYATDKTPVGISVLFDDGTVVEYTDNSEG